MCFSFFNIFISLEREGEKEGGGEREEEKEGGEGERGRRMEGEEREREGEEERERGREKDGGRGEGWREGREIGRKREGDHMSQSICNISPVPLYISLSVSDSSQSSLFHYLDCSSTQCHTVQHLLHLGVSSLS